MTNNFHSADCALRHDGDVCSCGFDNNITVLDSVSGVKGIFSGAYNMYGAFPTPESAKDFAIKVGVCNRKTIYVKSNLTMYVPRHDYEEFLAKFGEPEDIKVKPKPEPPKRKWVSK